MVWHVSNKFCGGNQYCFPLETVHGLLVILYGFSLCQRDAQHPFQCHFSGFVQTGFKFTLNLDFYNHETFLYLSHLSGYKHVVFVSIIKIHSKFLYSLSIQKCGQHNSYKTLSVLSVFNSSKTCIGLLLKNEIPSNCLLFWPF